MVCREGKNVGWRNLYRVPPTEDVTLEELEQLAMKRIAGGRMVLLLLSHALIHVAVLVLFHVFASCWCC